LKSFPPGFTLFLSLFSSQSLLFFSLLHLFSSLPSAFFSFFSLQFRLIHFFLLLHLLTHLNLLFILHNITALISFITCIGTDCNFTHSWSVDIFFRNFLFIDFLL